MSLSGFAIRIAADAILNQTADNYCPTVAARERLLINS